MMLGMSKVETIEREILGLNAEEFAMLMARIEKEQEIRENQSFEAAIAHRQAFFKLSVEEQDEQLRLASIEAMKMGIYDPNHDSMALIDAALDDGLFDE